MILLRKLRKAEGWQSGACHLSLCSFNHRCSFKIYFCTERLKRIAYSFSFSQVGIKINHLSYSRGIQAPVCTSSEGLLDAIHACADLMGQGTCGGGRRRMPLSAATSHQVASAAMISASSMKMIEVWSLSQLTFQYVLHSCQQY